MILKVHDNEITLCPEDARYMVNSISVDDENCEWIDKIKDILENIPEDWNSHIEQEHFYSIIKMEFNNLTSDKMKLETNELDTDAEEKYKEHLIHCASACILALKHCED